MLASIEKQGYELLAASDFASTQIFSNSEGFGVFAGYWNNLTFDPYMKDGGRYRRRRYGQFILNNASNRLEFLGNAPFFQAEKYNTLNGGVYRQFECLTSEFQQSDLLHEFIRYFASRQPLSKISTSWLVNVHQIRVECSKGVAGMATPEGVHQDGHRFVAQILIDRRNVEGGESILYSSLENEVARITLKNSLDAIFVDDEKLWHNVTPVVTSPSQMHGYRDMLLLDFNISESAK